MSMLLEKRQEIAEKLTALLIKRESEIEAKVTAYREQLEKEPCPEIEEIRKVLSAFDSVMLYDTETAKVVEEPKVVIEEPVVAEPTPVKETPKIETIDLNVVQAQLEEPPVVEARPGMPEITNPERS